MLITLPQKLINNCISCTAIIVYSINNEKKKATSIIASLVGGLEVVEITSFPPF